MKKEKKDTSLLIRINTKKKERLKEICTDTKTNMNKLIDNLIGDAIDTYDINHKIEDIIHDTFK